MRRRTVIAVVSVILILVIGSVVWLISYYFSQPRALSEILTNSGFKELRPASTFHGPGTINAMESISGDKLYPTEICTFRAEYYEKEIKPYLRVSSSTEQDIIRALSGKVTISGQIKRQFQAEFGSNVVDDVTLTLRNVKLIAIADEVLISIRENFSTNCRKAIAIRTDELRHHVYQTQAVLQADLVYQIKFGAGVAATQKATVRHKVAAELLQEVDTKSAEKIVGVGLYFGIKLYPQRIWTTYSGPK